MRKKKIGHVVRVSDDAWDYISGTETRSAREAVDILILEMQDLRAHLERIMKRKPLYVLPESGVVCKTLEEARGEAIIRAVRAGRKKPTEKPIEVREVV